MRRKTRSPSVGEARVYRKLKAAIVAGHFEPGTPLIQEELCRQFRASRTPVRDALTHLRAEGLVVAIPHKGVFVRELSPKDVRDIYEIRMLLESAAARDAVGKIGKKELQEILAEALKLRQKRDLSFESVRRTGNKLHRLIVASAGNRMMGETLDRVWAPIEISRIPFRDSMERLGQINEEHIGIIQAFLREDRAMAGELMRTHLALSREAHLRLLVGSEAPEVGRAFATLERPGRDATIPDQRRS